LIEKFSGNRNGTWLESCDCWCEASIYIL